MSRKNVKSGFLSVVRVAVFACCVAVHAATPPKAPDAMKVVMYCDQGSGYDLEGRLLDECPEFIVTFASGQEIGEGALEGAALVVHSGGGGQRQFFGLGEKGVAAEREFIRKGGAYHGTCAGAFLVLEETRRKRNHMLPFKPDDPQMYRGGATVELEFTEEGLAAMGQKGPRMVRYHGGPAMIPGKPVEEANIKVFAYYGKKMTKIENPKADVLGMAGKAAILAGTFGKGKIFVCGPHPESAPSTQDIFYKGVEWLVGRKIHPSPVPSDKDARKVCVKSGRSVPEGARLSQKLWSDRKYKRVLSAQKCDVAVLINPKKKTFDGIKDFKGPVIVFATQKEDKEAVEKSGRHDLIVVSSIDEALSKINGTL